MTLQHMVPFSFPTHLNDENGKEMRRHVEAWPDEYRLGRFLTRAAPAANSPSCTRSFRTRARP